MADNVTRILAPSPGPMTNTGTNTYLIDGGNGSLALVDPGPDDLPTHKAAILDAVGSKGRLEAVFVTHFHSDHLPLGKQLADELGIPLCGHSELPGVTKAMDDGEVFELGLARIQALHTLGHTDDSVSYLEMDGQSLFTGDTVAGAGSLVISDEPGSLGKYMRSLARLTALGEIFIYPGHGPLVPEGQAKLLEYVTHREGREKQIVAALDHHEARSVDDILAVVYVGTPANLMAPAGKNVRAHLSKLADEGKVTSVGGLWRLVG